MLIFSYENENEYFLTFYYEWSNNLYIFITVFSPSFHISPPGTEDESNQGFLLVQ